MEKGSIAKISRPIAKEAFPRKRLFNLLGRMWNVPITWVSGPAGCGKTTLVSNYISDRRLPCLWYQVDEGDQDIATFFYYTGLAVKKASRKRKSLPLLTPEYLQDIPTFTRRFFENAFSQLKPSTVLVLDNYQLVPEKSGFHEVLLRGLSAIPEGFHVILISRTSPPSAWVRLQANRLMEVLGWDELRLTLEESSGIIRLRATEIRSKKTIEHLHLGADGWAAGLILMLESVKRGTDPHLLGKFPPEEIIHYFGNELFNKRDKQDREFFLKTAFLPKMTAKMAEDLTGLAQAGGILSRLSRNNYFTQKHPHADPVYGYHPLFREFLVSRAKEMFSPEILSDLIHRAATLLEETGQTEDAISLFHDIGDWGSMIQIIMKQAPSMHEQGRYRPLEGWLDSLPKDLVENNPWLLYWKGVSQFPFDPSVAQFYFERAFEQFRTQGSLSGSLLAWSSVVESIFFRLDDVSKVDYWIRRFPGLPENPEASIPSEIWVRVVSSMFSALTNRHPEHSEVKDWIGRATSIVRGSGSPLDKARVLFHLVHWYVVIGDYEQSSLTLQSLQHLSQSKESLPFVLILTRLAEAMHYQLTGDHEKCLTAVSEGLKTSEDSGIFSLRSSLMGHAISSCQNVGDLEMAQAVLQKMASSMDHPTLVDKGHYHFCQTRQSLLQCQLGAASTHAELGLKTGMASGLFSASAVMYLLAAQVMHRIGKHREAWNHLHQAFRLGEKSRSKIWEYFCLMIKAHFHFEGDDEVSGLLSLRKALAIGKERGFLNTYVDQPAVTAGLCMRALDEGIEVPYVQDIIRKRRLIPDKPPHHLENWPWRLKIFTLGRFELIRDGKPIEPSKKVQGKPLSILKIMVALGERDVRPEDISDILWPEADGDSSHHTLQVTLHRLRFLIGYPDALQFREGRLTLNSRYCWVDAWAFERLLEEADTRWREGPSERAVQLTEKAIGLYRGPFLGREVEEAWAMSMRERLSNKFLRSVGKQADHWSRAGEWEKARECYRKGLDVDDLAEGFCQGLMICCQNLDQRAEALSLYQRFEKRLKTVLGIEPSERTKALRNAIVKT